MGFDAYGAGMRHGIGSHTSPNNGHSVDWLTPPEIPRCLGDFDLDPCACAGSPFRFAKECRIDFEHGLEPWAGRVWLNPPYGDQCGVWLERLARHGNGIAVVFARTETQMFVNHVWAAADAVFFFHGRLHFYRPDGSRAKGNAGGPSCLVAYGANNVLAIKLAVERGDLKGTLVTAWK